MEKCLDHLTQRVSAALAFWGLPEQMPELLKYRENAVFKVRLRDGNPAALRLHRPGYHARAALVSELAWMDDLRKHAIAVPQPLAALDGAFLVALVSPDGATCHADLIGWVEGEPLGETGTPLSRHGRDLPAVFHAIGGEMARMHEAADGFSRPAGFERPAWDVAGLLGDAPFWGRFWDCETLSAQDRIYLSRLREDLSVVLADLAPQLDQGLIHADLVRENVFLRDGSVAFIDFDDCGFGFRLFDLATVLLRNRREPDYPALRAALLSGYEAVRPRLAREFEHLPLFLLLRALTYIGWAAARPELPDNIARLNRYVADVRAVVEEEGISR
ncbi:MULTISPECIES: phosphotransferase enzyme family protein [Brucella]|nr:MULTISPECIES: phosphotransferase enzyme family protein [Brucella]KEY02936.1 serine kinase [Brucella inopinata BO1]KFH19020.1 serine kinase [Brucella abortus LMN1]KFH25851.1 serine kinase [Brucella abortus LMN2]ABX64322.1 Homoserine kinase [Brucella canis ATCC 23365]ACO02925.1 Homoserine kinase [Brucella melitensis ATCC 23457]